MTRSFRFTRADRLSGRLQFRAVFDVRLRQPAGPMLLYTRANGLTHSRLGLSVSRQVGAAARRNRIKRLLREAFRLGRHDWPVGYDWVLVVRAHEPMKLADYQRLLGEATRAAEKQWRRRSRT